MVLGVLNKHFLIICGRTVHVMLTNYRYDINMMLIKYRRDISEMIKCYEFNVDEILIQFSVPKKATDVCSTH